jgi:hypothetical protein
LRISKAYYFAMLRLCLILNMNMAWFSMVNILLVKLRKGEGG